MFGYQQEIEKRKRKEKRFLQGLGTREYFPGRPPSGAPSLKSEVNSPIPIKGHRDICMIQYSRRDDHFCCLDVDKPNNLASQK